MVPVGAVADVGELGLHASARAPSIGTPLTETIRSWALMRPVWPDWFGYNSEAMPTSPPEGKKIAVITPITSPSP
jgi:hypothetical protein